MPKFNNLHNIADGIPKRAEQLVTAYQAYGLDAAVQLAPVDEGDLRNSGTLLPSTSKYERRIGFTAEHAPHQEYGTVHMQAQPFLRPAFAKLRAAFKRDLRSILKP